MKLIDISSRFQNFDDLFKITDFEQALDIYRYDDNSLRFNLNSTIMFSVNVDQLETYQLKHDMQWPLISYSLYGTVRLAWLLIKLNGASGLGMFATLKAGTVVSYVTGETLRSIINIINGE